MKHIFNVAVAVSLLTLVLIVPGTNQVYAQGGADDTSGSTSSGSGSGSDSTSGSTSGSESTSGGGSTSSGSGSTTGGSGSGSASIRPRVRSEAPKTTEHPEGTENPEMETETADAPDSKAEMHKKGDALLAKLREKRGDKPEKTAAEKEKQCDSHKQGLEHKFANMVTNSQRTQVRITTIYSKALAYKAESKVEDNALEALIVTANAAQKTSAASIAALKSVTPSLECNNTSVASEVADFKVSAEATRTDIQAYRTAVKNVLTSLETAKPVEDGAEGSAQ